MYDHKTTAENYFAAFHKGDLDEVYSYLSDDAVVRYGTEEPRKAKDFFTASKELISQLTFTTLGVFTSAAVPRVIIHFSFDVPAGDQALTTVEAVDVIEFDEQGMINSIVVIPND